MGLTIWERKAIGRLQQLAAEHPPRPVLYSQAFMTGFAAALSMQLAPLVVQRRYRLAFNRWLAALQDVTLEQMETQDMDIVSKVLGGLGPYDGDDTRLPPIWPSVLEV